VAHVGTVSDCLRISSATIFVSCWVKGVAITLRRGVFIMRNFDRKYSLLAAAFALLLLTIAIGCKGFFVNQPNSLTVTTGANGGGSSTFTVPTGQTVKLYATATYSSGNKDVTNSATWQSSTPCATVNQGQVKGIGVASGISVTATLNGIGGSATGSVTGNGQGLVIASNPSGTTFANGSTASFTATFNGTDVTASTTWTSSSNIATFNNNVATFSGTGPATITGSYVNGNTCAGASVNITVQ